MIYDEFSPSRTRRTLTAGGRTLRALGLDGPLTGVLAIIVVIGILVVYSASGQNWKMVQHHLANIGIAVAAMLALAKFSTPQYLRMFAPIAYVLGVLLLIVVDLKGHVGKGAQRWLDIGFMRFQPSEIMKLALVLYVARYLADHPKRLRGFKQAMAPVAVVAVPALLLIVVEPDLGTALVIAFTIGSLLVVAGIQLRHLGALAAIATGCVLVLAVAQPYERARLTSFLHPWSVQSGAGYQAVQGQIALGSGGLLGVGLGRSVQKTFYLPEAQTDFILAVVGEELGVLGVLVVVCLYAMVAYAGLRTARRAVDPYAKLLASGLTSLILCQGTLNIFVVLGIAPLTGVPLPFISYAPTNLCVLLSAIGLLQNVSRPRARQLRVVDESTRATRAVGRSERPADPDRSRRHSGARGAGAGGRRRAAG